MKQLELMASFLVSAIFSFSVMPLYINIHFAAGVATHSLDYRKSAGGFIHGYRYTSNLNMFSTPQYNVHVFD